MSILPLSTLCSLSRPCRLALKADRYQFSETKPIRGFLSTCEADVPSRCSPAAAVQWCPKKLLVETEQLPLLFIFCMCFMQSLLAASCSTEPAFCWGSSLSDARFNVVSKGRANIRGYFYLAMIASSKRAQFWSSGSKNGWKNTKTWIFLEFFCFVSAKLVNLTVSLNVEPAHLSVSEINSQSCHTGSNQWN